jgi:hypothetical protein
MADKILFGGPPPANVTDFPPGTLWLQLTRLGSDVSGKTIQADVWSSLLCNTIDWGDNAITNPAAWTTAPAGGAPGKLTAQHVYTGRGGTIYRLMVEAGGVRTWAQVEAGEPVIVDDVSRDGVIRPPQDDQASIFAERSRQAVSTRKQMRQVAEATNPTGGPVN